MYIGSFQFPHYDSNRITMPSSALMMPRLSSAFVASRCLLAVISLLTSAIVISPPLEIKSFLNSVAVVPSACLPPQVIH